jgi:hypothetical protein
MNTELKVGVKIWRFDGNRRVYAPKKPGQLYATGGPIYRHHWHEVEIKSETSRSWVTLYGKCPKSGDHRGWAFTEEEVNDHCWVNDYVHKIERLVGNCRDAKTLKQIAAIVGFAPHP